MTKKKRDWKWVEAWNRAFDDETERMWREGKIDGKKHPKEDEDEQE